jgi:hypothetical protein
MEVSIFIVIWVIMPHGLIGAESSFHQNNTYKIYIAQ